MAEPLPHRIAQVCITLTVTTLWTAAFILVVPSVLFGATASWLERNR